MLFVIENEATNPWKKGVLVGLVYLETSSDSVHKKIKGVNRRENFLIRSQMY